MPEVVLILSTAIAAADKKVRVCHVMYQSGQNDFRPLSEDDLWIKQDSNPAIWVSCSVSSAMYSRRYRCRRQTDLAAQDASKQFCVELVEYSEGQ